MTWRTDKLILVGIDGGSWNVLEPWCREEVMPTLTALRREGAFGVLRSVIPPITPSAWTSILTGQRPGRHRVLDFLRYHPGTGRLSLVNSTDLPRSNLFTLLSAASREVVAVNLPMTYPPPEVSGVLVSGFETPSRESAFTWPPELKEEVLRVVPQYRFSVPWQARSPEDLDGLARDVRAITASFADRVRLARHLARRRPWNLLFVHLKFYDDLLHRTFGYTRPEADPRGRALLERCLRGLDEALGRLRSLAREVRAPLLVVSDHGFGSLRGRLYPNALLHRWGYLALRGPAGRLLHRLRRRLRSRGPDSAHHLGARIPIHWRRTRAYVMYTGPCPFVYVNRRGREPHGTVGPAEAGALVAELAERLRSYRHPALEGPVFEEVIRAEEFFPERSDEDPELILVPREGLVPRRRLVGAGREVTLESTLEGYHRRAGLWLAAGPNIRPGVTLEAGLEDVLPTVLAALGVPLPAEMDGRPLCELFEEPPQVRSAAGPEAAGPSRRDVYSAEEEAELRRRLQDLGYL